jgi:uncharacterized protein (TIGR00369 family)
VSLQPVTFAEAEAVLGGQPFSVHLGAILTAFGQGRATIELPIRSVHRQQVGLVHGGVVAYAADNAIAFAAGSLLGPAVLTTGLTVEYLRSARDGTLRASADVIDVHRNQAVCTAGVVLVRDDGTVTLCAKAQGRVTASSQGSTSSMSWRAT